MLTTELIFRETNWHLQKYRTPSSSNQSQQAKSNRCSGTQTTTITCLNTTERIQWQVQALDSAISISGLKLILVDSSLQSLRQIKASSPSSSLSINPANLEKDQLKKKYNPYSSVLRQISTAMLWNIKMSTSCTGLAQSPLLHVETGKARQSKTLKLWVIIMRFCTQTPERVTGEKSIIFVILKSRNQSDEWCLESTSFFVLTKKAQCDEQQSPSSAQIVHAQCTQEMGWELQLEARTGSSSWRKCQLKYPFLLRWWQANSTWLHKGTFVTNIPTSKPQN